MTGHPILDAGNSVITLDPNAGPPMIHSDGMITQGTQQIGAIGLFSIDEGAALTCKRHPLETSDRDSRFCAQRSCARLY